MLEKYERLGTGSQINHQYTSITGVTGVLHETVNGYLSDLVETKAKLKSDLDANRIHAQVGINPYPCDMVIRV